MGHYLQMVHVIHQGWWLILSIFKSNTTLGGFHSFMYELQKQTQRQRQKTKNTLLGEGHNKYELFFFNEC